MIYNQRVDHLIDVPSGLRAVENNIVISAENRTAVSRIPANLPEGSA